MQLGYESRHYVTEPRDTDLASSGSEELLLLLQILPFGSQGLLLCVLLTPQVAGQDTRTRSHTVKRMSAQATTHTRVLREHAFHNAANACKENYSTKY